jgi:MFS family permease
MSMSNDRGFGSVLSNRQFRNLWASQVINQTAQNCINFVQIILVEQLTGSSTQLGVVILSFTLPGVLFSPIAGIMVDRWPKKWILVGSNALRALLVCGYLLALAVLKGFPLLLAIYLLTFVTAAIAQFFGPAEGATIPLLVGEERLLAANSIFSLTLAASQVAGLIVLGPLIVKLIGVRASFFIIALAYVVAAWFVSRLPKDPPHVLNKASPDPNGVASGWRRAWAELREGWTFVATHRKVLLPVMQLALVATLLMVMATLAPGFAARVLGMAPEDAVVVFAPAGAGMLAAIVLLGRYGYLLRKDVASYACLASAGVGFLLLGLVSRGFHTLKMPIFDVFPQWAFSMTSAVAAISLLMGLSMSSANILATTLVQENTPARMRGRVFALQFMLNSGAGLIPMFALAAIADLWGIPRVLMAISVMVLGVAMGAYLLSERAVPAFSPDLASPADRMQPSSVSGDGNQRPIDKPMKMQ